MIAKVSAREYMNAQGLATHLRVTERTVRRWIERGELHAEKRGRSFVIRREDGERARVRLLGGARADDRAQLEAAATQRDLELAEWRGRYAELQARVADLDRQLAEERRRSALLEAERDLLTRRAA